MSWLNAFGRFWYDFIVGDSVVLAVGTLASLAIAALLVHNSMNMLAAVAAPALVSITLGISLRADR